MPDNNKNKGKNKKDNSFDKQSFKKGIAYIESRSYKNPYEALPYYTDKDGSKKLASSASGKYQFLWKELSESNPQLLSGITKEQFLKNPELQEKVMDMAIEGGLRNRPSYYKNAMDIKNEFQKSFGDNWNFRDDEIAALTHFLGRGGTRQYLRSLLNDTKFKTPGEINVKPLKYLEEYNKGIGRERGLLKTNENNIDIINNSHLNDITLKPVTQDNLKLDNFLQTNKILPDSTIDRKAYTQENIKPNTNVKDDNSVTSFLHNYLSSNNLAYGGIVDPPIKSAGNTPYKMPESAIKKDLLGKTEPLQITKEYRTDINGRSPIGVPPKIKETYTIPDYQTQVPFTNQFAPYENQSTKEFSDWYNDPITRKRIYEQTSYNPSQVDDLVTHGMAAKADSSLPLSKNTKGEYYPKKHSIAYNNESPVLFHERVHASGLDQQLGEKLLGVLGNPFQQKEANTFSNVKRYMSQPHEAYGNFAEFRKRLGLKPGQQIDETTLYNIVKEKELQNENFYKTFDKDKIIEALNTIAYQNNTSNNNYAALGGKQNTNNMNQLLTEFNEGGTHEQNPFGGIFQGIGNNGKPNTVEEGETKAGGYVFSDRLKLDSKILKKYNLPTNLKNKTAAEASKELNKQYKESLSNIDKESTKEMLSRLTTANDELRMIENPSSTQDNNQMFLGGREQQNPALSYQPQGMQQMVDPNLLLQQSGNKGASELAGIGGEGLLKGAGSGGGPGVGGYMNVASTALDFGNQLFGDSGIDESGMQRYDKVNQGGEALGGAMKGAKAGMAFGPWGAAIGGVVGGITGLISGGKKKKEIAKANHNFTLAQNSKLRESDFAYGGKISNKNKYAMGGFTDDEVYGDVQDFLRKQSLEKPLFDISGQTGTNMFSIMDDAPNKNSNFDFGNLANNAMRYVPVATNLLQLSELGNPEVERLDKLDKRYQPDYVDEQSLINKVSNAGANVRRSLTEASGGDLAALRSNLLASQINETKGLSDAFVQAENINRRENQIGQQFDLNVDSFNIGQSNTEKDINARNRAAYENNKSKLISQLGTDIGNIGLENLRKKYPERAGLLYDYLGSLITDKETA